MSTDEIVAQRNLKRAGVDRMVTQRQALAEDKKILEAKIRKLSAKIMGAMAREDIYSIVANEFKVTMIVDAAYESFDRDKFTRYLIEHKVAPRLIKSAESVALEKKVKAPHLRVSGGN